MKEQQSIMVLGEAGDGGLSPVTKEVLCAAQKLSTATDKKLCLCLLGARPNAAAADQGFAYGAEKVYTGADPLLEPYAADAWLQALTAMIQALKPLVVLMGHTDKGMDLAPRLAFRLHTGAVLDCVDIVITEQRDPIYVKPVFGGKAHGRMQLSHRYPHIATIREGAFEPEAAAQGHGRTTDFPVSIDAAAIRTRFVRKEVDESQALANRLSAANLVVCAGRGVKNRQGVELVVHTADLLNAAVAATRPVVDNGWLPYSLQVGLTGKKVHPLIYVAVGVSGAIQHMAGCLKSKTIVALNSDENAPIFKMAHLGAVGDFQPLLQGFNDELKKAGSAGQEVAND